MPDFDPITGEPLDKNRGKQENLPVAQHESLVDKEKGFIEREKREHPFLVKFFSMDNPLWTVIPILISLTALLFAYKSTTISREINDVHLRVTALVVTAYHVPDWNFTRDNHFYCPGVVGGQEDFKTSLKDAPMATAINSLSMRWGMMSVGMDLSKTDLSNLPYVQHYHYLVVSNDSTQIAQDFRVKFDYYPKEDTQELRGKKFIPDGVEKKEWEFGPAPVAPGQTILFPIGSSFIRYDPSENLPGDLYRNFDVQYFGEFYYPLEITYSTNVSGEHRIPIDLNKVIPVVGQFNTPPEGPVGERAKQANESIQSTVNQQAENIVQNLAPEGSVAQQSEGGGQSQAPAKSHPR